MPKCYLVSFRVPETGVVEREALMPVGTLLDMREQDLVDILSHIEMVARRSYHKIQAQMNDPVTMDNEFHRFVPANKTELAKYGHRLLGFFPVMQGARTVGRSTTEDRIHTIEAYLVYEVEDNHVLD